MCLLGSFFLQLNNIWFVFFASHFGIHSVCGLQLSLELNRYNFRLVLLLSLLLLLQNVDTRRARVCMYCNSKDRVNVPSVQCCTDVFVLFICFVEHGEMFVPLFFFLSLHTSDTVSNKIRILFQLFCCFRRFLDEKSKSISNKITAWDFRLFCVREADLICVNKVVKDRKFAFLYAM